MEAVLLFLKSGAGRAVIVGILFAGALASCSVQSARLKHAKADLTEAQAALVDPHTRMKWQAEYEISAANLTTCHADRDSFRAEVDRQAAATTALKTEVDRKTAANAAALQAARKQGATSLAEAERILGIRSAGGDTCQRLLDAERQITEGSR